MRIKKGDFGIAVRSQVAGRDVVVPDYFHGRRYTEWADGRQVPCRLRIGSWDIYNGAKEAMADTYSALPAPFRLNFNLRTDIDDAVRWAIAYARAASDTFICHYNDQSVTSRIGFICVHVIPVT